MVTAQANIADKAVTSFRLCGRFSESLAVYVQLVWFQELRVRWKYMQFTDAKLVKKHNQSLTLLFLNLQM